MTKIGIGNFELVDKGICNWFQSIRSRNVLLSVVMIQKKAHTFAKKLNAEIFRASDGWL